MPFSNFSVYLSNGFASNDNREILGMIGPFYSRKQTLGSAGMSWAIELSGCYFYCLGLHRVSFVFEIEKSDRLSKTRVSIAAPNPCDSHSASSGQLSWVAFSVSSQ